MSVSRTVSEIFSVKEWNDLETGDRSRSTSMLLKIAPFDRSCHSSIALSMMVWSMPCQTCRKRCFSSQHLCR